jgi:hypothetical protein
MNITSKAGEISFLFVCPGHHYQYNPPLTAMTKDHRNATAQTLRRLDSYLSSSER